MQNPYLRSAVYVLFFLVCLAFFTVQGFPVEIVQGKLEREVQRRLGMKLTTGSLEILFPNGLEATNLRLAKEGEEGKPGLAILVSRARARISLLALLAGVKDISFSAELLAGKVEGDLRLEESLQRIEADLSALDLGRLPVWQDLLGLPLAGKVTGRLDLALSPKDIKESRGTIVLALEQGSLGEGTIRGLSTPAISLGKTQANLEIGKGKLDIKSFQVRSDDIEASLEGYFLLQKNIEALSARCKLRFKPSDDFLGRNPKFKDLINLSGMNRAKDNDGNFSYSVYGRLDSPQFRPLR